MGKKTGFLMATVHQGSATAMWKALAEETSNHPEDALFVFPGGRISFPESSEYLRNDIYSLANSQNLDGQVIWASTLTGKVGDEAAKEFVKSKASDMPVVSIGLSVDGVSSVDFDAYSGVFKAVSHLINHHGIRKVAFLRGPETHPSAEARYQAYLDVLKEYSIPIDHRIISSPRPWSEGEKSAIELLDERKLIPGVDFEAVVAPSDYILFWAIKHFEKRGVRIPSVVKTIGFNDSWENKMNAVATSTVRMPITSLATTSLGLLGNMIDFPSATAQNILLPTELILRRSCGCVDSFGGKEKARREIYDWQSLRRWIGSVSESQKCADALYSILRELYVVGWSARGESADAINAALEIYFDNGGTSNFLFESMKWSEELLGATRLGIEEREVLHAFAVHHTGRVNALSSFEKKSMNEVLDAFNMELLATSSLTQLLQKMRESLPKLHVKKAFIVLRKDDNTSVFAGGYDGSELYKDKVEFSAHLMVDNSHLDNISKGMFIIEPLIYDNRCIGYVIFGVDESISGTMLESLRSILSAAFKSIELFKIAAEKSASAEAAEKKSSEFYSNLSEGLREPLTSIRALADSDAEIDKDELRNHVTKAAHLLELSLSERGEVAIKPSFVPLSTILRELELHLSAEVLTEGTLPSVVIDKKYLLDVFKIIKGVISARGDKMVVSAKTSKTSLVFSVKGKEDLWIPRDNESDSSMLLAEKIIMLHSGSYKFGSSSFSFELPYPRLSGEVGLFANDGSLVYISNGEAVPECLEKLGAVVVREDALLQAFSLPDDTVAIAWDASQERKSSTIILNLLKSHVSTKNLPFLCFGIEQECISLITALEGSLPQSDRATIFSFGHFPSTLKKLAEFGSVVEVTSLSDAEEGDGEGALMVLYDLDIDYISKVRSSRKFGRTPILIVKDTFTAKEAELLSETPSVLMVNTSITESEEFISRVVGIFGGGELLPPLTSALVKRSIAFINKNASSQISRWQLAAAVNISEDYLTRIFRREIGISPWDYLNRYRIQLACKMLTQTGASVNEIASDTGFQDQAYFCRVFKKVKGFPPGHIRQRT
ncbi:MAG: helix-turn-helix domain-containing protein [Spirochaetales bacterium]|nr:helix-turn-helix domain-containing protein [Spirochaetales bacterium]